MRLPPSPESHQCPTTITSPARPAPAPGAGTRSWFRSAFSCLFPRARAYTKLASSPLSQRTRADDAPDGTWHNRTARKVVGILLSKNASGEDMVRQLSSLAGPAGDINDKTLLAILQGLTPSELAAAGASLTTLRESAKGGQLQALDMLHACVNATAVAAFDRAAGKTIKVLLENDANSKAGRDQLRALAEATKALSPGKAPGTGNGEGLTVMLRTLSTNQLVRLRTSLASPGTPAEESTLLHDPDTARALMLLEAATADAVIEAEEAVRDALGRQGKGLRDAILGGDVNSIYRWGKQMKASFSILSTLSDEFTALGSLPVSATKDASVHKDALIDKLQHETLWKMAAEAAGMHLVRVALRPAFGIDLPPMPGTTHATAAVLAGPEALITTPASKHEQRWVQVGNYRVGETFRADVKRGFDLQQESGAPLISGCVPGMTDAEADACIAKAMPTLIDICNGDEAQAQAVSSLGSQALFAPIQLAVFTLMNENPAVLPVPGTYTVGSQSARTPPALERSMVQFVKTGDNPELIVHYQAEGGLLKSDDGAQIQLAPSSWVRATIRIKLTSAHPATFALQAPPLVEVMLSLPSSQDERQVAAPQHTPTTK